MSGMAQTQRQVAIIEWLNDRGSLTIAELVDRFQVSTMTIHRDLDKLAGEGLVKKVRGGILPAGMPDVSGQRSEVCRMCGKRVPARTQWVVTQPDGERWQACCAHCGLLQLHHGLQPQSALAADFLYGRMVNVYQATFVVGSDVTPCCVPSTLCFITRHDAERFAKGFGGDVMAFAEALVAMNRMHHMSSMDGVNNPRKVDQ